MGRVSLDRAGRDLRCGSRGLCLEGCGPGLWGEDCENTVCLRFVANAMAVEMYIPRRALLGLWTKGEREAFAQASDLDFGSRMAVEFRGGLMGPG